MKNLVFILRGLLCVALLSPPLLAQATPESLQYSHNPALLNHPVPAWFFNLETHWVEPWPVLPAAGFRLWDTGTTWSDLNPRDGVYDWGNLDAWLAKAQKNGNSLLYTMAMTPRWASSDPGDSTCHYGPGQCDPPNDLNADGTGSNQHWKNFVAAIATHAAGKIRYWEIWNEPVNGGYWTGTFPQMVRLAQDARTVILSIDPKAKLLTPPNGANSPWVLKWWTAYGAAGGLQYADIAALHGGPQSDCGNPPQAADFITSVQNLRSVLHSFKQGKPIWDTESSWGTVNLNCFTDPDLQAAFLAQFYFFHRSMEIERFYWYSYYDSNTGQLYDSDIGKLTKGGVAYQQVHDWMFGKTLTGCSADNTIWTCTFITPTGYQGEAIWDTARTCSQGDCQTEQYSVDKIYTHYRTLGGETVSITNGEAPIGAKPILLEK
jgi:polysaccharide biosynthesis protein PslG